MNAECPKCQGSLVVNDDSTDVQCPHCQHNLDPVFQEEGIILLAATDETPAEQGPATETPLDDPILDDHHKWRVGAFFAALLGLVGLFLIAFMSYKDYQAYGPTFFKAGTNPHLLIGFGIFCLLCLVGGVLLYTAVGRETRSYLKARQGRKVRQTLENNSANRA